MRAGRGQKKSGMGGKQSGNRWNESRDRNRAGVEGTGDTGVGHRTLEWDMGHWDGTLRWDTRS